VKKNTPPLLATGAHLTVYPVLFNLYVFTGEPTQHPMLVRIFGTDASDEDWQDADAMCVYEPEPFTVSLMLRRETLTHNMIAHEIFHATHHIMEHIEHHLTAADHEPHAYLCGYLTKLVYACLKKHRVLIRN
jgi:hypothetical protein